MRFYDYKCPGCGKVKEYYENTDNNVKRICDCGSLMKRVISPVSFNIKNKPLYWKMSVSERKRRWNSPDPTEKI